MHLRPLIMSITLTLTACGAPGSGPFAPSAKKPEPFIPEPEMLDCGDTSAAYAREIHMAASLTWEGLQVIEQTPDPEDRAFRRWFDRTSPPNKSPWRSDVGLALERMHKNGFERGFKVQCDPDRIFPDDLYCSRPPKEDHMPPNAFTWPDGVGSDTLFICPRFDKLDGDSGLYSRAGTIAHEVSHWTRTWGTKDLRGYVQPEEAELLNSDPKKSTTNAYNVEYFLCDNPWPIACSAAPGRRGGTGWTALAVPLLLLACRRRTSANLAARRQLAPDLRVPSYFRGPRPHPQAVLDGTRVPSPSGRGDLDCITPKRRGRAPWERVGTPALMAALMALAVLAAAGCAHRRGSYERPLEPWVAPSLGSVVCHLTMVADAVEVGAPVELRMEIQNKNRRPVLVEDTGTPFELHIFGDAYEVRGTDGQLLRYRGPWASRRRDDGAYFVVPGRARRAATFDLAPLYGVAAPGVYKIAFPGRFDVQPAFSTLPTKSPRNMVDLGCNEVTVVVRLAAETTKP